MPLIYPPGVLWFDEGVEVLRSDRVSFEGAGVTLADDGDGGIVVTIPGGGGPGASMPVDNEGVNITPAATLLDFVGAGVHATASGDDVTVNIPGAVSDVLANRPAAAADNEGMVYYATDVDLAYISDGSTWTTTIISAAGLTGTTAQFNSALSDGDFATLAGSETLTGKTIALGSNTISGSLAEFNAALTGADFATLAGSEILTNKTINLASNTLTGTTSEFNTALSDGDFATLAGTETLSNKTLTLPQINDTSSDHQYVFAVSELAADRTVTLPLLTASDTFVFESHTQTLANKTLTTPTIASFTNATHNHQNAAGGGQLDHGAALTGLTDDDHTQYALLAGRTGGQTLIGGTGSANNLTLQSTSNATKGFINLDDRQEWMPSNVTVTGAGTASTFLYVTVDHTLSMNGSTVVFDGQSLSALAFRPTVVWGANSNPISAGSLFSNGTTHRNTNGVARSMTGFWAYYDGGVYQADGSTFTLLGVNFSFNSSPFITTTGSGTLDGSTASVIAFNSGLTVNKASGTAATLGTRKGFNFTDTTGGADPGTLTTQIGIDIAALSFATTNIGIRNASTYVATPSSAQTISAVGNTILANAEVVQVSNTTGGALTLTSTPTIANGQDGQKVTIVSTGTQTVTLQDQGTLANSNLRLTAVSIGLGPRDSVTLMYSSSIGDWIQITPVTNVL